MYYCTVTPQSPRLVSQVSPTLRETNTQSRQPTRSVEQINLHAVGLSFPLKKILQDFLAMFSKDRFRMKLNSVDWIGPVTNAHQLVLASDGGDLQTIGQRFGDDQRMVAPC